jgi:protein-S-isoprenylcysteine O-methyltransferase Ste14
MNQTVVRLFAALRGFVYASGFVFIWWLVVASVRPLDQRLGVAMPEWAWTPGLVLVILGGALAASCVASFALVGKGTPAPFDPPREFVAVGPYRYVRNPMYLGAVAVIIGAGLMIRSVSALAVSLVFMALAHVFVLAYEEPTLEGTFGASYRRYKSSVNRWVPRKPRTTPIEPSSF